ncbi:TPM domain-containing protein [Hyphomicrobium sulfonivorans]|uniref:TPM domain-containing protein n=1 Tax=Hyphomicrobium sulfonivorans TaxID=121290 RepID=UPI0015706FA7|nr:TPM domain-containing protein [Hyphomicrobium sulfonivorans]MBI1648349.1 TPM domain-containing protein [Hyphomicrobium sulfonivorans]NSL71115.1 hypothetical protein [Hyphomicrobium sulfonivorans]
MHAAASASPLSRAAQRPAMVTWPALVCAVACALLLASAGVTWAAPTFPALTGRIVDEANLLTPQQRADIDAQLTELEEISTDQVAVVTLNSLQGYAIEDYGYQLGRNWGIGQKDKDNGVLLIVAPNERKVRIEVGRGLEPTMTDAMSSLIVHNAILPQFRQGNFAGGIEAGVRDIKDVLLGDAEAVKERARAARTADDLDMWSIILIMFWLGITLFVIFAVVQSINTSPQAVAGQRRRAARGPIVIPGNYGGWGGGWPGGGGGGGWSGGGGGFGGGGSSGSW